MSDQGTPQGDPSAGAGARTAAEGTPVAVDVARDRRARRTWVVFLAGPVTWFAHFMVVYVVVEAGCTGEGAGLALFDPPVPKIVTLAATAVAALACLGFAAWAYRWWRAGPSDSSDSQAGASSRAAGFDDSRGPMAFAGLLLSLLSFVAVLFVGLPALVLPTC